MKCADIKYVTLPSFDQSWINYNFTEFESIPTKTDFTFVSMGSHPDVFDAYDDIVLLWMELPNCLCHMDENCLGHYKKTLNKINKIKKIYSNCPFSVDYFNKTNNFNKFEFSFHPTKLSSIPTQKEKIYDVYYTGNFPCPISFAIPTLEKFNYSIVSNNYGNYKGVSYNEKMILNSQSKISIVHNLLTWYDKNTKNYFPNHEAFKHLDQIPFVPQIKVRCFEAAASKSLILCLQDSWNMIESYFEEGKDFIYWKNEFDLEEKINHILNNYNNYIPIINHAYNTLINNFTTECFFNRYLKNL